jgi:hypothetical protein
MLYIDDVDDYSFTVSSPRGENVVTHNKSFFARNMTAVGNAPYGLVTIRSFDEHLFVCNGRKPSEISLNGIVYAESWVTAVVFNCMMNNDDECINNHLPTTTGEPATTEIPSTSTTEEPVTTTTDEVATTTTHAI